jgi:hypothetical protein
MSYLVSKEQLKPRTSIIDEHKVCVAQASDD